MDDDSLNARHNDDAYNVFPSLLLRLRLNDLALRNRSNEVPYEYCCPYVKELRSSRTCPQCEVYFASVKSIKEHKRICNQLAPDGEMDQFGTSSLRNRSNRRPVRVAARRGNQMLTLWTNRLNDLHSDWMDNDELQDQVVEEIEPNPSVNGNLLDMNKYMETPWEDQ